MILGLEDISYVTCSSKVTLSSCGASKSFRHKHKPTHCPTFIPLL